MRARALIRAWAKTTAIAVTAVALSACSPGQASDETLCRPLRDNIDAVAANGVRRVSDTFHVEVGVTRGPEVRVDRGDFAGSWTIEQIRACLGPEWVETHDIASGAGRGEAWVFVRAGGPMLIYMQEHRQSDGTSQRELDVRVMIEPASVPPVP
jgi:hypothetical protein